MSRHPRLTVALHVRISPKLKEQLGALADKSRESEREVVERALVAYVEAQRGAR